MYVLDLIFKKKIQLILVRGKQLFLHKLENIIVDFKHLNSDLHAYNMHHLELISTNLDFGEKTFLKEFNDIIKYFTKRDCI